MNIWWQRFSVWRFSQTNPSGCKSAKILLLLPGRRASHGAPPPWCSSTTKRFPVLLQETVLWLRRFIWDVRTLSLKTQTQFSVKLHCFQSSPTPLLTESLRRKTQPRHRFMVTAALDYSSTYSAILPQNKQHTYENSNMTTLRSKWAQLHLYEKNHRNIQCHILVIQRELGFG